MKSTNFTRNKTLQVLSIGAFTAMSGIAVCADQNYLTFEELASVRTQAHQDRFKTYVLKKLEVHSLVQNQRGMCLDFIGSDGLYRSKFDGGPLIVDLANCGEEADFVDGRVRGLRVLGPNEKREGLSKDQIDQVVAEVNALFDEKTYDSSIKE